MGACKRVRATQGTNTGGRSGREDKAFTAPTSHDAGRVTAVRELNIRRVTRELNSRRLKSSGNNNVAQRVHREAGKSADSQRQRQNGTAGAARQQQKALARQRKAETLYSRWLSHTKRLRLVAEMGNQNVQIATTQENTVNFFKGERFGFAGRAEGTRS